MVGKVKNNNDEQIEETDSDLDQFGKLFSEEYDNAIESLVRRLSSGDGENKVRFQKYLSTINEKDRILTSVQSALDSFAHDIMLLFQESAKFKIAVVEGTKLISILKVTDSEGLHSAQISWREKYSKYGLLEDRIDLALGDRE
jgi:hypothetical protein